MLIEEIIDLIQEYKRYKDRAKEVKEEMLKFIVEDLGIEQQEACRLDVLTFLDGYIVGKGYIQPWRLKDKPKEQH